MKVSLVISFCLLFIGLQAAQALSQVKLAYTYAAYEKDKSDRLIYPVSRVKIYWNNQYVENRAV
jgi:hypothetical protein